MACRQLSRQLSRCIVRVSNQKICHPMFNSLLRKNSIQNPSFVVPAATWNKRLYSSSSSPSSVFNVQDEDDFKKRVLKSQIPVIVDFHATWCGPCKLLGPRLEKIVDNQNGDVVLAKVDVDDHVEIAMQYGVQSVPTVIAVSKGEKVDEFIGLQSDDILESFVDKLKQ